LWQSDVANVRRGNGRKHVIDTSTEGIRNCAAGGQRSRIVRAMLMTMTVRMTRLQLRARIRRRAVVVRGRISRRVRVR
jgi:hypothetical protein